MTDFLKVRLFLNFEQKKMRSELSKNPSKFLWIPALFFSAFARNQTRVINIKNQILVYISKMPISIQPVWIIARNEENVHYFISINFSSQVSFYQFQNTKIRSFQHWNI